MKKKGVPYSEKRKEKGLPFLRKIICEIGRAHV